MQIGDLFLFLIRKTLNNKILFVIQLQNYHFLSWFNNNENFTIQEKQVSTKGAITMVV